MSLSKLCILLRSSLTIFSASVSSCFLVSLDIVGKASADSISFPYFFMFRVYHKNQDSFKKQKIFSDFRYLTKLAEIGIVYDCPVNKYLRSRRSLWLLSLIYTHKSFTALKYVCINTLHQIWNKIPQHHFFVNVTNTTRKKILEPLIVTVFLNMDKSAGILNLL